MKSGFALEKSALIGFFLCSRCLLLQWHTPYPALTSLQEWGKHSPDLLGLQLMPLHGSSRLESSTNLLKGYKERKHETPSRSPQPDSGRSCPLYIYFNHLTSEDMRSEVHETYMCSQLGRDC